MENESKQSKTEEASRGADSGRMDRLADQTKGLIDDVKEWIDLKVQLVQLDLEEKFETVANQLLAAALIVVLLFITLIFALIAGSLAIGKLLGDPLWGFLVVTGILAIATLIVHLVRPRFVTAPWTKKEKDTPAIKERPPAPQLPEVAGQSQIMETDDSGA